MALSRAARRRVPGLVEAVARYNREVGTGRWIGAVALGVTALAAAVGGALAILVLDAMLGEALPSGDGARWGLLSAIVLGQLVALAAFAPVARRHFGPPPADVVERLVREPGELAVAVLGEGTAEKAALFVPYAFGTFVELVGRPRLSVDRRDLEAAAELLTHSRDREELERFARGQRGLAGGLVLVDALGAGRLHPVHSAARALLDGTAAHRAEEREKVIGVREEWTSREWVPGKGFHLAGRSGHVLIEAPDRLTMFSPDGALAWQEVFPAGDEVTAAALAPDGRHIALVTARPEVWVVDAVTRKCLITRRVPDSVSAVAVSDGADWILLGDKLGTIRLLDRNLGLRHMLHLRHGVDRVALSLEAGRGLAGSERGNVSVFRLDGSHVRTTLVRSDLQRIWLEEDGERALLLTAGEGLMALDLDGDHLATYGLSRPALDGATDAPGDRVVLLTVDGRLVVLDVAGRIVWQGEAPAGSVAVRLDQAGDSLWCRAANGALVRLALLDDTDTARPALDLATDRAVRVEETSRIVLPKLSGYRRLAVDPDPGGRLALVDPSGVVVIAAADGTEQVRHRTRAGLGEARFASHGGLLAVAAEDRLLVFPRHGDVAPSETMIRGARLGPLVGASDLLVATADGDILCVTHEGTRTLASVERRIVGLGGLELGRVEDRGSRLVVAALANGTVRAFDGSGEELFRITEGLTDPVRVAFVAGSVLVADAQGGLRLVAPNGEIQVKRRLEHPIVAVEGIGTSFLVTDRGGHMHRYVHGLRPAGTRSPTRGFQRFGTGADGETWVATVADEVVALQTWTGEPLGRFSAEGTPLDLAPTPDGRWVLLTEGAIVRPVAPEVPDDEGSERASFLEL